MPTQLRLSRGPGGKLLGIILKDEENVLVSAAAKPGGGIVKSILGGKDGRGSVVLDEVTPCNFTGGLYDGGTQIALMTGGNVLTWEVKQIGDRTWIERKR